MDFKKALCVAAVMAAASSAFAAPSAEDVIRTTFQQRNNVAVQSVKPTPVPGIYEIYLGRLDQPVYTDATASFVLNAPLWNLKTNENLTEKSRQARQAELFKSLPYQNAVKQVFGKGERKLVVFSDPACTFCRTLEKSLERVGNVTVYTFLFPALPRGPVQIQDIICAKDPAKAWSDWMGHGVEPAHQRAGCDNGKIDANTDIAARFNVHGVPHMIFPDGTVQSGALDDGMLDKMLAEHQ